MVDELRICCHGAKGDFRDCMWPIKSLFIDVHRLLLEWFYHFPAPLMWMEMRLRLQGCFFLYSS